GRVQIMTASSETLFRLRLIVGFLGERAQFGWWPTAFFDESSRPFLAPVFTRTTGLARYHSVVEAARRLHDEHLSVGSFHLFRLPEELEQDLHALVQAAGEEALRGEELQQREAGLSELQRLAGGSSTRSIGPTLVGGIGSLAATGTIEGIAAAYLFGFQQNSRVYPYLAG
ncbi:MAG: BrxE family protein, partial [Blastocatellia bacterium]